MIEPTVGRIVWFHPVGGTPTGEPHAAKIAAVNEDKTINLGAIDHNGAAYSATNIFLRQDGEANPFATTGGWAQWMPYQVGQAKKTEEAVAAPALQLDTVTKAIDALASGTEGKFAELGRWLQTHVGDLLKRVAELEAKPSVLPSTPPAPPLTPPAGEATLNSV